jgi:acyl-CoA reductase-like NAD-dependent aldehyde dehydrogenase
MNIQSLIPALLSRNRYPLIAGVDTYADCETRQFESPIGIDLPQQIICGVIEIEKAIGNAKSAHTNGHWRNAERLSRKKNLLKWAALLEASAENLALMDCAQTGRSLKNFRQDSIPKAIEALRWFAELSDKIEDRSISEGHDPCYLTVIRREPVGVVAAIIPWNDPLVVFVWKVAPALICGNPVIVKASEYAFHSLVLATSLAYEAGIPSDQLQLVTGDGSTGALLVQHPDVACISFTGSSATGKWIATEASRQTLKRVSLECGGKSAFLVSDQSCSIDNAASCLAKNAFYNQGQICSAPTRAYVHSSVFDQFIAKLSDEAKNYQACDPLSDATDVGYMISREAVAKVNDAINNAVIRGNQIIYTAPKKQSVWSIAPTIFLDVPEIDSLAQTELFGPVLIVNRVSSMEEALKRANSSAYGLAASMWTDNLGEAISASARLEAGIVHVNSYGEDGNQIPFGGTKNSGIGKEKSIDSLAAYSHLKSVCIRLQPRAPNE